MSLSELEGDAKPAGGRTAFASPETGSCTLRNRRFQ